MRDVLLCIGSEWRRGGAGAADTFDPATEERIGRVALADAADLDAAIDAAARAFPAWRDTPAIERGAVLIRSAALLRERTVEIARLLTEEQGKTLAESQGELGRAAETFAWNGEEASRIEGRTLPGRGRGQQRTLMPEAVGVVAAITAWNFPAVLIARKLGAALAAGCTVVLKAAEETPATAAALIQALVDAGLPPGAVNLVFGDPPMVSRHLLSSPVIRKLTFTGSTAVGRQLALLAAPDLKRCTFELGGHAPVILCEDADLEAAAKATLAFKFASAGQSCIAPSRFYIHERHYAEFLERFTAGVRAIRIGEGREQGVGMGPLANPRRLAAMERLTRDALDKGSRLVIGGRRPDRPGWFWEPTVLAEVPEGAAVMNEEPFGPIAPFAKVASFDEAIERANRLDYGFAAYLFTASLKTAALAQSRLRAGNIGINQMSPTLPDSPVGGMVASGYGYEGGRAGIEAFLHFKLVSQTWS